LLEIKFIKIKKLRYAANQHFSMDASPHLTSHYPWEVRVFPFPFCIDLYKKIIISWTPFKCIIMLHHVWVAPHCLVFPCSAFGYLFVRAYIPLTWLLRVLMSCHDFLFFLAFHCTVFVCVAFFITTNKYFVPHFGSLRLDILCHAWIFYTFLSVLPFHEFRAFFAPSWIT
jgi:hypothetical protein